MGLAVKKKSVYIVAGVLKLILYCACFSKIDQPQLNYAKTNTKKENIDCFGYKKSFVVP